MKLTVQSKSNFHQYKYFITASLESNNHKLSIQKVNHFILIGNKNIIVISNSNKKITIFFFILIFLK